MCIGDVGKSKDLYICCCKFEVCLHLQFRVSYEKKNPNINRLDTGHTGVHVKELVLNVQKGKVLVKEAGIMSLLTAGQLWNYRSFLKFILASNSN